MIRWLTAVVLVCLLVTSSARAEEVFSKELIAAMDRQDELTRTGNLDQAIRDARAAVRQDTPEAHYLLGRALGNLALIRKRAGDQRGFLAKLEEAREAFYESKEVGGLLFAPAPLGLARCARIEGEMGEAERLYREALRIAPGFREAVMDLSEVLWERGSYDAAVAELATLVRGNPSDLDARFVLGRMRASRQDWERAEADFSAVVAARPNDVAVRKLFGLTLFYQDKFDQAARHFDAARRASPKDAELYQSLLLCYVKLQETDKAKAVLQDLVRELPDHEAAERARNTLAELARNPNYLNEIADTPTPEELVRQLEVGTDAVREKALHTMRELVWSALPAQVYELLLVAQAGPGVRRAAVMLIGDHADPRTLSILEVMLFHPRERETEPSVRRATVEAVGALATPAVLPVLYPILDDPDVEMREAAVAGIAARSGKWFRADLRTPTPAEAWAPEREKYRRWWASELGSFSRLEACQAMEKLFASLEKDKGRLAGYALEAMDDPYPRTFAAGYSLFRAMSGQSYGFETGAVPQEERRRIAQSARAWLNAHMARGN